jgi:hypothetical protein
MNLPGFAAEGSLYTSAGQYQSVAARSVLAGKVLPSSCCSECAEIICRCTPEQNIYPGQCESYLISCNGARNACLDTCVPCPTQPPRASCCPKGCIGTCPY